MSVLVQKRGSVAREGVEVCWVDCRKTPLQLPVWTSLSSEQEMLSYQACLPRYVPLLPLDSVYLHLSPGLLAWPSHWPPRTHVHIAWIQYWLFPPCDIGVGISKLIYERLHRFRLNHPIINYYCIGSHLSKATVKRRSSLIFYQLSF